MIVWVKDGKGSGCGQMPFIVFLHRLPEVKKGHYHDHLDHGSANIAHWLL